MKRLFDLSDSASAAALRIFQTLKVDPRDYQAQHLSKLMKSMLPVTLQIPVVFPPMPNQVLAVFVAKNVYFYTGSCKFCKKNLCDLKDASA